MRSVRRIVASPILLLLVLVAATPPTPARAQGDPEYTLETAAAYDVRPDDGEIAVTVEMTLTNTTPDTATEISVFPEILLAVHDGAAEPTASDGEGDLDVEVAANDDGVNVATIGLREGLRFEQSVDVELRYMLPDGGDPQLRVRPSLVVFPVWAFGTAGEVRVNVPAGYEVRTDGDALTPSEEGLVSGPISEPSRWLAVVTATSPVEYRTFETTVPLDGGTADLQVRAFADDEAWGQSTLELVERALPLLEREIGLPYPQVGPLVLTESVSTDASGFGEATTAGTEILVAFDEPPFTALHQVAHVWLTPAMAESRWIREGLASDVAERVAAEIDVETPYDPAEEAAAQADAAMALDSWTSGADPAVERFGHAASWAFVRDIRADLGDEALREVLARASASIGPYDHADVGASADGTSSAQSPLTSRGFLDQLEAVSDADLADRFAASILLEGDVALLEPRAAALDAMAGLEAAADGWGSPDPVRAAMAAWSFDEATGLIDEARAWMDQRDDLLADMEAVGLSAPDRLQQAYRSYGGGAEAQDELESESAIVEAYADTAAEVNAERSLLARIGLVGGPDPAQRLAMANGRFAEGDLMGAASAIEDAQRIIDSAEISGLIRLAIAFLVIVLLAAVAFLLMRRRSSYTSGP